MIKLKNLSTKLKWLDWRVLKVGSLTNLLSTIRGGILLREVARGAVLSLCLVALLILNHLSTNLPKLVRIMLSLRDLIGLALILRILNMVITKVLKLPRIETPVMKPNLNTCLLNIPTNTALQDSWRVPTDLLMPLKGHMAVGKKEIIKWWQLPNLITRTLIIL